ncbi:alpha-amylase family glycosyl hydrolase [Roseateles sp. NT4]|uniref:alpha-amylase family glycosyl hydrolase n=1 Tax=Roseateles sp. NT4 TaxID=3453715 RepID=UPI003EEADCF7
MNSSRDKFSIAAALLAAAALAACGGGGGSAPSPSPAPAPTPAPAPAPLPAPDVSTVVAADPGYALPDGWQLGAFMQIFVRSYQDSDGDGIGDLRGVTSRLDYLKDLGVKGIWLMPITKSQDGDHGYAVADYRDIEPAYGKLADLDELIKQAHARGIGVILDYVMNHSAGQHPLFVNAKDSATNPWRDWYVWQNPAPTGWSIYGGNPWRSTANGAYYAPFWDQMPDFNLLKTEVVDFHKNTLRFWLNRGVDGFRFDAVGNLVENGPNAWEDQPRNYTLMNEMRVLLNGYSNRYMVCEGPADPQGFGAPSACGSAFAFDLQNALMGSAKGQVSAVASLANYFKTATPGMAPMLSNHDSFAGLRPADQLNADLTQLKLAASAYLLLPGTPFIYYGEEIGMRGATSLSGDAAIRTPMSWSTAANAGFSTAAPYRALASNAATNNVAAQQADPDSLLNHYRALLNLRNTLPALRNGALWYGTAVDTVLTYQRFFAGQTVVVAINFGTSAAQTSSPNLPSNAILEGKLGAADIKVDATGTAQIAVPAQSLRVYVLR